MRRKRKNLYILLIVSAIVAVSCSDGIFNFNPETGNISFSFTVDSSGGDEVSKVVFNFSNSQDGSQIRREVIVESSSASCYISRADIGTWNLTTTVYLSDGSVAVNRTDSFDLGLAQTAIAEFNYWSDGSSRQLDILWEQVGSADTVSMITLDDVDTLTTAFHAMGTSLDAAVIHTTIIGKGSGFSTSIKGLRVNFPDSTYFEYSGGWARTFSNIEVEVGALYLTVNIKDYSSKGDYSLTLTDLNDVETKGSDNCYFDFDPVYGFATITNYTGLTTLGSAGGDYDINNSDQAGSYIVYIVEKVDGTAVNNGASNPTVWPVGTDPLPITGAGVPVAQDGYAVLATIDAVLTQPEIDTAFSAGTTNLLPENLPNWLFMQFGDRINFVGLSVAEYAFP